MEKDKSSKDSSPIKTKVPKEQTGNFEKKGGTRYVHYNLQKIPYNNTLKKLDGLSFFCLQIIQYHKMKTNKDINFFLNLKEFLQ